MGTTLTNFCVRNVEEWLGRGMDWDYEDSRRKKEGVLRTF